MISADAARRLADHVRTRMADLNLRYADIPARGGPSTAWLRQLLRAADRGDPFKSVQIGTLRKLDDALEDEEGNARRVLMGGTARPRPKVGVIHGTDPELGPVVLVVPDDVLRGFAALGPAARAEAEADALAAFLRSYRALRESHAVRG